MKVKLLQHGILHFLVALLVIQLRSLTESIACFEFVQPSSDLENFAALEHYQFLACGLCVENFEHI